MVETVTTTSLTETPGSEDVLTTGAIHAAHSYTNGGIYTIIVTVRDDDSGTASTTSTAYVTGVGLHNGVLQIVGTTGKDHVHVKKKRGKIEVQTDFTSPRKNRSTSSDVTSIHIVLADGQDFVRVDDRVDQPTTIDAGAGRDHVYAGGGSTTVYAGPGNDHVFGGRNDDLFFGEDGNDFLSGGRGNDILIGGAGNDLLSGGWGDDILVGGQNRDILLGSFGEDLLIAGFTTFDNNEQALHAIRAEWTSGNHGYDTRVANLRGDNTRPEFSNRLNGAFYLTKEDDEATVFDDDARDLVFGGFGRDWYFLDHDDDWLLGRQRKEQVN